MQTWARYTHSFNGFLPHSENIQRPWAYHAKYSMFFPLLFFFSFSHLIYCSSIQYLKSHFSSFDCGKLFAVLQGARHSQASSPLHKWLLCPVAFPPWLILFTPRDQLNSFLLDESFSDPFPGRVKGSPHILPATSANFHCNILSLSPKHTVT